MKTLTAIFVFILPLLAYAEQTNDIASLRIELSSINITRKLERERAQALYTQLERGEIDIAILDKSYTEIEARVSLLNKQKSSLEEKIVRMGLIPNATAQNTHEKEAVRPPVPMAAKIGGAIVDFFLFIGRIFLYGVILLLAGLLVISWLGKPKPRQDVQPQNMNHTLSSTFGLSVDQIRRRANSATGRTSTNRPGKLHSGDVPDHLI